VTAGFVGFEIAWRKDVFGGAPQAGSAEKFGTLGINFRARKAASEEELLAALASSSCEIPALSTESPRAGEKAGDNEP
jgi:hypothetical protein